jgi:hypothetical protein
VAVIVSQFCQGVCAAGLSEAACKKAKSACENTKMRPYKGDRRLQTASGQKQTYIMKKAMFTSGRLYLFGGSSMQPLKKQYSLSN